MRYTNTSEYDYALSHSIYEAMKEKNAKKLQFAKCPNCKKTNTYRLANLHNSELNCKSCNAPIPIEQHTEAFPLAQT